MEGWKTYRVYLVEINSNATIGTLEMQPSRPWHFTSSSIFVVVFALSVEHDLVSLAGTEWENLVHNVQAFCLPFPGLQVYVQDVCQIRGVSQG